MFCKVRILAISQDRGLCDFLESSLESEGHEAVCVSSSHQAQEALEGATEWNFLLLDAARNTSMDDLFSPQLLQRFANKQICIASEMGESAWTRHAERWAINQVLMKPLLRRDLDKLLFLSTSPLSSPPMAIPLPPLASPSQPAQHTPYLLEELDNHGFFLAASPTMMRIHENIRVLATVDYPVLILGESGVGKEVVARLLHNYHARSAQKFINVNTAALPSELLESELFGYEVGAFTGAVKAKPGKFELADKGTLLLDEIGEMSPMMQAKLLHVLQDGSFSRLGARQSTQVDVRILAATNVDLEVAIAERRFREDLYYRLNAFTITVPSLRERREEIPLLMEQMMFRGAARAGQEPVAFSTRLIEAAQEYHWPGNLRELRNFVTRMLVLRDQEAALAHFKAKSRAKFADRVPVEQTLELAGNATLGMKSVVNDVKYQTESRMIKEALSASGWNRRRAAANLNISYRALLYKIQQHGLTA